MRVSRAVFRLAVAEPENAMILVGTVPCLYTRFEIKAFVSLMTLYSLAFSSYSITIVSTSPDWAQQSRQSRIVPIGLYTHATRRELYTVGVLIRAGALILSQLPWVRAFPDQFLQVRRRLARLRAEVETKPGLSSIVDRRLHHTSDIFAAHDGRLRRCE